MLETPSIRSYLLFNDAGDNATGAGNQQGSRSTSVELTPQRLHAELLAASPPISCAYLRGALHDATLSVRHRTVRFGQAEPEWLEVLATLLRGCGQRSWMYREGRDRRFWVLETSDRWMSSPMATIVTDAQRLAYARGYFDAEGGIPQAPTAHRFYIQLVQKNHADLEQLRDMLTGLGIECGRLHNPSVRIDPTMWRFYVRAASHLAFVASVGSWHPRKRRCLEAWLLRRESEQTVRMKI